MPLKKRDLGVEEAIAKTEKQFLEQGVPPEHAKNIPRMSACLADESLLVPANSCPDVVFLHFRKALSDALNETDQFDEAELLQRCTTCHELEPILKQRFDVHAPEALYKTFYLMSRRNIVE